MSLIRYPAMAGRFYPKEENVLLSMIDDYLKNTTAPYEPNQKLKAIVAPHAGYIYSGPVAGASYKQLESLDKKKHWKIFLLGPSHRVPLQGISVCAQDIHQTPLGPVTISSIAKTLAKEYGFVPQADQNEHSLEVQLPFLQRVLPSFELIPIVIGQAPPQALARILAPLLDEDSLLVVSTDLSHFHGYNEACEIDSIANQAIPEINIPLMQSKGDACGIVGVLTAMELAQQLGWKGQFLDYKNSGDTAGSKDQVVGYGAYSFTA